MTKTAGRKINAQLRGLRADRKRWLSGQNSPWGMPWCDGPGAPYHQGPGCEGCACRAWNQEHGLPITEEIRRLEEQLAPVVQGALW